MAEKRKREQNEPTEYSADSASSAPPQCSSPTVKRPRRDTASVVEISRRISQSEETPASTNIYTQLDHNPKSGISTRLLQILPELSSHGLVQCNLVPVSLDIKARVTREVTQSSQSSIVDPYIRNDTESTVQTSLLSRVPAVARPSNTGYNTLSYVWGDQVNLRDILVNGVQHKIRWNLWAFLKHILGQQRFIENWWWIDALCIDQTNDAEKSYQVQKMGIIYCNSALNISWLGNDLEYLDVMFDTVKSYESRMEDRLQETRDREEHEAAFAEACLECSLSVEDWYALYDKMFWLEFWHRAWIAQEFLLSPSGLVLTGSNDVRALCLAYANMASSGLLQQIPGWKSKESPESDCLLYVGMTLLLVYKGAIMMYQSGPLASFHNNQHSRCSEPKDYIYSQLSMVVGGDKFHIDYAEHNWLLFLRTALFCNRGTETLSSVGTLGWPAIAGYLGTGPQTLMSLTARPVTTDLPWYRLLRQCELQTVTLIDMREHSRDPIVTATPEESSCSMEPRLAHCLSTKLGRGKGRVLLIEFAKPGDPEQGLLRLQYCGFTGLIRQNAPVETDDGKACLSLSTCLWIAAVCEIEERKEENVSSSATDEDVSSSATDTDTED